jgi:hypothetical protein
VLADEDVSTSTMSGCPRRDKPAMFACSICTPEGAEYEFPLEKDIAVAGLANEDVRKETSLWRRWRTRTSA